MLDMIYQEKLRAQKTHKKNMEIIKNYLLTDFEKQKMLSDNFDAMMNIEEILKNNKLAVMATTDENGLPFLRWMTIVLLDEYRGAVFTVSRKHALKCRHIEERPIVELMFQDRNLERILNAKGKVDFVVSPTIRGQVLDALTSEEGSSWLLNENVDDFVVLKINIESAVLYFPGQGRVEQI